MLLIRQTQRTIPFYRSVPLTSLPLIYHREHLFPYVSGGDTEREPVLRDFRMVSLENEFIRVETAPELGGRIYNLFDKRIGKEILFSNPVVKPVRVLPVWLFVSGGIEFNFPIAHSPTSTSAVGCSTGQTGDYGFIRVGEREARTGMEWVVEIGLVEGSPVVFQRTALRNATKRDHPWMMWTIAAVSSTDQTEFVHPPHRVLVHDDRVVEMDWPGDGCNWERNAKQMTAFFWKPGGSPHFGAFHHDLGFGLMHLAEPQLLPGKKVWTYGHGRYCSWASATTSGGLAYAEIESGPLLDQSEKATFRAGTERRFEECWIPVHSRDDCAAVARPQLNLPPMADPWLGWKHSAWQCEWEEFRAGVGPRPSSCVPPGLELEEALRRDRNAAEPLALWLAFRARPDEALRFVENDSSPGAQRIAGLILWKARGEFARAVPHLEAGPLTDPVAVVELDELYAELGMNDRRAALLSGAPAHRLVTERRASLALAVGNPAECIQLLAAASWPREHQRYVRTELWKAAHAALGQPGAPVPAELGEDNLARFGAYWSD